MQIFIPKSFYLLLARVSINYPMLSFMDSFEFNNYPSDDRFWRKLIIVLVIFFLVMFYSSQVMGVDSFNN